MPIDTTTPSADDYQRTIDQYRAHIEALEAEVQRLRDAPQGWVDCQHGEDHVAREHIAYAEQAEAERDRWRETAVRVTVIGNEIHAIVDRFTAAGPPDGGADVAQLLADLRAALRPDAP